MFNKPIKNVEMKLNGKEKARIFRKICGVLIQVGLAITAAGFTCGLAGAFVSDKNRQKAIKNKQGKR